MKKKTKKKKFKLRCKDCGKLVAETEDPIAVRHFAGRCVRCDVEFLVKKNK